MHSESAMPLAAKLSCIRNERKRINVRCSSPTDAQRHQENFSALLRQNGYAEHVLRKPAVHSRKKPKRRPPPSDTIYFQFPFVTDSVQRRVQAIFTKNGLPVSVFDHNTTLRNALQKKQQEKTCNLKDCSIANSNLCYTRRCVYKLECTKCPHFYIGSTLRCLHERVREHLQQERSSVFQHKSNCGATFDVKVIAKARDNTTLRFKEALLIRDTKPTINAKREIDELLSLTTF